MLTDRHSKETNWMNLDGSAFASRHHLGLHVWLLKDIRFRQEEEEGEEEDPYNTN